jgi:hypothetical protein
MIASYYRFPKAIVKGTTRSEVFEEVRDLEGVNVSVGIRTSYLHWLTASSSLDVPREVAGGRAKYRYSARRFPSRKEGWLFVTELKSIDIQL